MGEGPRPEPIGTTAASRSPPAPSRLGLSELFPAESGRICFGGGGYFCLFRRRRRAMRLGRSGDQGAWGDGVCAERPWLLFKPRRAIGPFWGSTEQLRFARTLIPFAMEGSQRGPFQG